ncbi:sugar ABC transporter permease [Thermopolyspora flexuosa]|uniref:Carbohydrate ABC transporter membrane protein 1 (CUT1 family) n=1 Tax=Thermopolyspora flexuosa TaxID=103836 RepID=A0A543IWX6_9ACTN|nr:carbohydrate ABC transporter membrane protein 1 (CUT1 family) [Thermopolyspora flexuosa]GGM92475.1 sugar ABC transporter permease [Thermopolyspora flexuosa]
MPVASDLKVVGTTARQGVRDRSRSRTLLRPPSFEMRMMAPALLVLAALSLLPFLTLIYMSFSEVKLLGGLRFEPVGLENWQRLFTDPDVRASWVVSLIYLALTLGLEMLGGVLVALVLYRITRGRGLVFALVLLPMFLAPIIVGLLGRFMTDYTIGLYAWVLRGLGFESDVLGEGTTAMIAVVAMDAWQWTPLVVLITLAGLTAVPPPLFEAAAVDGAGYWQTLRSVVFPTIKGVLLVALLVRAMDAVRFFDIITITTNGGPADATKIIPIRLYETAFRFREIGYASVIGLVMLLFSIILANVFVGVLGRKGLTK